MKSPPRVALVAAGPVSRSGIVRVPRLLDQLGPVKGPSLRVASRIVGSLRAGYGVPCYTELADAQAIFICVPTKDIDSTVTELLDQKWSWQRRVVVLWHPVLDSVTLSRLAAKGAYTASICPVEGFTGTEYLIEGHLHATALLRRMVEERETRVVEVKPGKKVMWQAGVAFATVLSTPLAEACFRALQEAGVGPHDASRIGETQLIASIRLYFKRGKRGWKPLDGEARQAMEQQHKELAHHFPEFALLYDCCWRLLRDRNS